MMVTMKVISFFLISFCVVTTTIYAAELIEKSIEHDGLTRWFLEYEPDNMSSNPALVILVHGGTESMRELFTNSRWKGSTRWLDVCDTNGFLLLAPNGVNIETGDTFGDTQNWSDIRVLDDPTNIKPINDDIGFIENLIQLSIATHNIDPSKVYITGSSNGGIMTYTMLLKKPELFAAGVAFIANLPSFPIEQPKIPVPIMIMNGNKDRLMKWDGGNLPSDVGGNVRSAIATRDFWINANRATTTNIMTSILPNRNIFDRCRIYSEYYPPTLPLEIEELSSSSNSTTTQSSIVAAPVLFYTMDGSGHSMPIQTGFFNIRKNIYDILLGGPSCHDVNGADLAWEFMSTYTSSFIEV